VSFRLRVLTLIMFIAVTATAATAWLTLRQASRQVTDSVVAGRQDVEQIVQELRDYGGRHGTWDGVPATVRRLTQQTSQRIRLATDSGTVVADSDLLDGRAARPVGSLSTLVDPRPVLPVPATVTPDSFVKTVVNLISQYRSGVRYAACLTAAGVDVAVTAGPDRMPRFAAAGNRGQAIPRGCTEPARVQVSKKDLDRDLTSVQSCLVNGIARSAGEDNSQFTTCVRRMFTQRIGEFAPQPLQLYVGTRNQPPATLAVAPTAVAAAVVATAAVVVALLLSQRVLRPIGALTRASQRLGAGDLSQRVPVAGTDELAELGRSFNRMADSLQRGEERQRHIVADVAHELRTPLANLRGYLEALKDGVFAASPELFASLHEEAVLQQRIVDDLQDLALAEAGALTYHRIRMDLAELLETCRTAHLARAERAGVSLAVETEGQAHVYGDPDRLRQVIGNLMANALRVTGAGGTVVLGASRRDGFATIRVADTGTGIPEADVSHVFDRFWRGDSARGRATGNGGLGLAIARQIVTDHHGSITVVSELGVGTTFTIVLPSPAHS
jgi:two-component system sensor histidine kinase BaeS